MSMFQFNILLNNNWIYDVIHQYTKGDANVCKTNILTGNSYVRQHFPNACNIKLKKFLVSDIIKKKWQTECLVTPHLILENCSSWGIYLSAWYSTRCFKIRQQWTWSDLDTCMLQFMHIFVGNEESKRWSCFNCKG